MTEVMHRGATMQTKKRGGARPGAGRTNVLGETSRRDLRIPVRIEREAIRVGKGNFAQGIRIMCEGYIHTMERAVSAEPPPLATPVLVCVDGRWAIAEAAEVGGAIVFLETCSGQPLQANAWRNLPAPEVPEPE